MKKLYTLLALVLLSFPVFAIEQEMTPLSYYGEISVPGMDYSAIFDRLWTWERDEGDEMGVIMSNTDYKENYDYDVRFTNVSIKHNDYFLSMVVFVDCFDDKCTIELTNIQAWVNGWSLTGTHNWFLTEDMSGNREGLFRLYNRKHIKRAESWLQSYFDDLMDSLAEYLTSE